MIIIDDLDRCQPDAVLQVLEAVNYLVAAGPCFVVLGVDRGQIEHAVGLGFKDIVEGLPDQELRHLQALPKDADETLRKSAKRRAYARYYLEKLFNIEVAVPRLEADAAVRMLVVDETAAARRADLAAGPQERRRLRGQRRPGRVAGSAREPACGPAAGATGRPARRDRCADRC